MPNFEEIELLGKNSRMSMLSASARQTWSASGAQIGTWIMDLSNAASVYAGVSPDNPLGNIEMMANGRLAFELTDVADWSPVIALGDSALSGRPMLIRIAYSWDGNQMVYRDHTGEWDERLGRTVAVGPTSDGSLSGAGTISHITVELTDGQPWQFADCLVGWVQIVP